MPGGQKMFEEFSKIKGMPLESKITMGMAGMETKIRTLVTSVEKKSISSSEFEVPSGYKKVKSDLEDMYRK